jgi:hypothetical protein
MGKASKLKAQRAAARLEPTAGRIPDPQIRSAFQLVGHLFGDDPDCAGSAAVLKVMADELGYGLRPIAVSVIAYSSSDDRFLVMGPRATATFSKDEQASLVEGRTGGRDTGHMVLISDDPPFLFDPNIRQLTSYGMPVPSIATPLEGSLESDSEWTVTVDGVDLHYFVDEDNHSLDGAYARGLERHGEMARELAAGIKAGQTFFQLRDRYSRKS